MLRRAVLVPALLAAVLVGLPVGATARAQATADDGTPVYVALGDSFASGPGIPVQEPTGCLRSTSNYAKLLARRLGHALRDVTCSGADTADMTKPQGVSPEKNLNGVGVPPQFDALGDDVDLVTLQIGGNDIGFGSIAQDCLDQARRGGTCRDPHVADDGDSRGGIAGNGIDDLRDRIAATAPKVAATIEGIRARAPRAKVLVLGYSGIFAFGPVAGCPAMLVGEEDARYLRGVQEDLNQMIAAQAADHGGHYVDVHGPSAGHTACDAPAIRWVEPVVPANAAAPIHPNLTGMVAVADLLFDAATREQAMQQSLSCSSNRPTKPWVLLVHGTGVTSAENWSWGYEPDLLRRGHGVCRVDLPHRSLNDIQVSGAFVAHAIRTIYEANGSNRIHVLGHSQGGLSPRWALRWWPELRAMVDDVVTLGTPHQGTETAESIVAGYTCEACHQMQQGSDFIEALNSWDQTPGAISYTSIWTQYDEAVRPVTNAELADDGANVTNVRVQDVGGRNSFCQWRAVDHLGLAGDAVAHALVLDAFSRPGPAEPGAVPAAVCSQVSFTNGTWNTGAYEDQWRNDGGRLATGARYGTAEPRLAPYVHATRLQISAPATVTATDTITVTAALSDVGGQPLAGRDVGFRLGGSHATATTSPAGLATVSMVVDHDAGPGEVRATFAGDPRYRSTIAQRALTVEHEATTLRYVGNTSARGETVTLSARLADDDSDAPVAGRRVHFAIGSATATASTDAAGVATAVVAVPDHGRTQQVVARFDGDGRYRAATAEAAITWGGRT